MKAFARAAARSALKESMAAIERKVESVKDWSSPTTDQLTATLSLVTEARRNLNDTAKALNLEIETQASFSKDFLAGNPVSQTVRLEKLRTKAYTDLHWVAVIDGSLGRLEAGLRSLGGSSAGLSPTNDGIEGRRLTIINPNLFGLATQYYGSAEEWTVIAKANGVTSPTLDGLWNLIIPAARPTTESGGILYGPSGGRDY